MHTSLENAELVAKQAITEELGTEICQTCGCNPQWSIKFPALESRNRALTTDLKNSLANASWLHYQQTAETARRSNEGYWLRTKVKKQRQALARMYLEVNHLKAELKRERRNKPCDTQTSSDILTPETT